MRTHATSGIDGKQERGPTSSKAKSKLLKKRRWKKRKRKEEQEALARQINRLTTETALLGGDALLPIHEELKKATASLEAIGTS
ncbi:MAG: hypothetical protein V1889_01955 [archaeon]